MRNAIVVFALLLAACSTPTTPVVTEPETLPGLWEAAPDTLYFGSAYFSHNSTMVYGDAKLILTREYVDITPRRTQGDTTWVSVMRTGEFRLEYRYKQVLSRTEILTYVSDGSGKLVGSTLTLTAPGWDLTATWTKSKALSTFITLTYPRIYTSHDTFVYVTAPITYAKVAA